MRRQQEPDQQACPAQNHFNISKLIFISIWNRQRNPEVCTERYNPIIAKGALPPLCFKCEHQPGFLHLETSDAILQIKASLFGL